MACTATRAARLLLLDGFCAARLGLTVRGPALHRFSDVSCSSSVPAQHNPLLGPAARHCSTSTLKGTEARLDSIQRAFAEAREEIELAREDMGTVYFNESADEARSLVDQVLTDFGDVLQSVSEDQRGALQRSMGLKMEQLKAELKELDHLHDDD